MGRRILKMSDVILAQLLGHSPGWRIKANPLPADARTIRAWVGSCHNPQTVFLEMESDSWPEISLGEVIPFVDPEPILEAIEPPGFEVGPGEVHVTTATILRDIYLERCSRDNVVFRSIENGCLTFWRPESASSAGDPPQGWVDKGVASGGLSSPGLWYQCDRWDLAVATNARDGSETWFLSPRDAGHARLATGEDCHRFATKDQAFAWAEANDRPAPEMPSPPSREETWRDRSIRDPMI